VITSLKNKFGWEWGDNSTSVGDQLLTLLTAKLNLHITIASMATTSIGTSHIDDLPNFNNIEMEFELRLRSS